MPETDTTDQASLCELPAIGQPLMGGTFAGITTQADGTHCAVILLADKPTSRLGWKQAMEWAQGLGAQLPTRPVAAMLFATSRAAFERDWHWTSEVHEADGAFAWDQYFSYGGQGNLPLRYKGCARAVRLIHLVP